MVNKDKRMRLFSHIFIMQTVTHTTSKHPLMYQIYHNSVLGLFFIINVYKHEVRALVFVLQFMYKTILLRCKLHFQLRKGVLLYAIFGKLLILVLNYI